MIVYLNKTALKEHIIPRCPLRYAHKKRKDNGEKMNNENKKTEQLIQIYKEDTAQENLKALLHQMKKTVFLTPAMLPDTPEVRELKKKIKENPGEQVQIPKSIVPIPAILNNQKGEKFFPIYSSTEQIPKEPKFDLLMNIPFWSCCKLSLEKSLETQGMVLNAFTANLSFKNEMLQALLKEENKKSSDQKAIKLTPEQFQIMMRKKAELHDFPFRVYQEGAEFIQTLSDEKEKIVDEVYRNAYQNQELYPYEEDSFSVMALNIRQDLLLVQVDLPKVKKVEGLCHRIYITLNSTDNEIHYFTIEQGKKKKERKLGGVDASGKHMEYGEAPVESAELQHILDLLRRESEGTEE